MWVILHIFIFCLLNHLKWKMVLCFEIEECLLCIFQSEDIKHGPEVHYFHTSYLFKNINCSLHLLLCCQLLISFHIHLLAELLNLIMPDHYLLFLKMFIAGHCPFLCSAFSKKHCNLESFYSFEFSSVEYIIPIKLLHSTGHIIFIKGKSFALSYLKECIIFHYWLS